MGEKRTVYSVSMGEYSDYGVLYLFEDSADAEANAARHPGWYVQEFDLYGPGSGDVLKPWHAVSATAYVNGEGRILDHVEVYAWHQDDPADAHDLPPVGGVTKRERWPLPHPNPPLATGPYYCVMAVAGDVERARKAAQERAAKVAARVARGQPVKIG